MFRQIRRFQSKLIEKSRKEIKEAQLKNVRQRKMKKRLDEDTLGKINRNGKAF